MAARKPAPAMIDGVTVVAKPRRGAARQAPRMPAGPEEPELPMLPADCPIVPLGVRGNIFYFLDQMGQLIPLASDKVAQKHIQGLLKQKVHLAQQWWPRYGPPNKDGTPNITGVKWDVATQLLIGAASHEGVFDPIGKVRGRGAHKGPDGELILHCGSKIYVGPAPGQAEDERPWCDPGVIDGKVYPTGADVPRPSREPADPLAIDELFAMMGTWNWAREIDPVLLIGWIGAAMLGGALRWRPHCWITGDSAAGKSTLQELIENVFDGALLQSTDATEAGIRQVLGYDTLPVALDEIEAEEDNRRANAIIKLARTASSGGRGVRGGQDHQGHEFTARSCFLFSSILLPPMLDQDRNRLAILELFTLAKGAKPPVLERRALATTGRMLLRQLIDRWPQFEETLGDMRAALAKVGHGGRSADQFGTLLACAFLLIGEDGDRQACAFDWAAQLDARGLAEKSGETSNSLRCAGHLASSILPPMGGEEPRTVASWTLRQLEGEHYDRTKSRLGTHGLRVVRVQRDADDDDGRARYKIGDPEPEPQATPRRELFLAVACSSRGLDPLWRDSLWQGRAGAAGGWSQALGRIEHALKGQKVRIGGAKIAVVLVPLDAIADLDGAKGVVG